MATYTTLDRYQIERLLKNYDVGPLLHFEALSGGKANSSIIISSGKGRFVLSVCDEKESGEIDSLTAILEYLDEHDFPTTRIVRTVSGRSMVALGDKPVYLKEYIEGRVETEFSPSMVHQVGMVLARLHEVPTHHKLPQEFAYGIEAFDEIVCGESRGGYPEWLLEKKELIKGACSEDLPRGFVHGDLFSDNILFMDNKLVAVLDFEEACIYFLLFDLGMCVTGCCTVNGRFSLDLAAELIHGYQSVRKLQPLEQQLLQLHIEYGAVATSFWRYRQYNQRYPEAGQSMLYKEMTVLAEEVHDIPEGKFIKKIFG